MRPSIQVLAGARSVTAKELANRTKARRKNSRQSWRKPASRLARVRRRPIVNVARFLERRSEAAQHWRWSLKLRRQRRPLRPAAGSASLADGGLRRENWPPIGVMIHGSAAGADQHFKGAIVIEPNLDRVWAALMTGAQPGRTPFTVLQLATSGLDGAPRVRGVILRSVDAERYEPRVSLIGYDPDAGFQIRLEGKASIDTEGPEKAAAWAACRSHTRALLRRPLPSGTPIAAPTEAAPADDGDGEGRFALVVVSVIRIDWLDVSGRLCHGNLILVPGNPEAGVRSQAAVAARHVRKASVRRARSVWRDVRWRWTLKVLWTAA